MVKLIGLLLLAQVPTPLEAMMIAHADLRAQAADERADYLYLSTHNVLAAERQKLIAVLNGHCNSTSREVGREPVAVVDAAALVLRVNLRDYGWRKSNIRKLADPRFTVPVDEETGAVVLPWEGGVWPGDGKFYKKGAFRYEKPRRAKSTAGVAPWLTEGPAAQAAAVDLVAWGDDYFPMVSALYFLNDTAIQDGRTVGYYGLLGIKTQRDFEAIVRFDQKLAIDLEHRRVVIESGITLQPRRIEITRSILGPLWRTFDNEFARDERNPIRELDNSRFQFDATEQIAALPNGLPGFLLADAKGNAQGKAPDQVVGGDRTGHGNDTRLHANISCIRCHNLNKGENFIKEIDFAKLQRLKSYDRDTLRDLKRLYTRDIVPDVNHARQQFGQAILETTGMQPFEYAAAYEHFFSMVENARVDARYAGADMGVDAKELVRRLRAYDGQKDIDPVLSVIMNGGTVPIRQWEEVIHLAHAAVRSVR